MKLEGIERFAFYEQAKKCYAVIATGLVLLWIVRCRETSQYANIILQKGVITNPEFLFFCFETEDSHSAVFSKLARTLLRCFFI